MGYVRARKTYRITFDEGHDLAGLEVVARSATVATYQRLAALKDRDTNAVPTVEDLAENDAVYRAFASVLVSWNLEEPKNPAKPDGPTKPVPATYEGLVAQDPEFVDTIILAWMQAIAGPMTAPASLDLPVSPLVP